MYSHTKKIGSMGRYGPRIGRKVREEAKKIEEESRRTRDCPSCGKKRTVRRVVSGIWSCKTCGIKFTGGAHLPVSKKAVISIEAEPEPKAD
ncbi:MAG: 50S ribosomal protein L37ae [Candidatus Altiarchaeota archaeon]|nr:50S ribosomal protein L37ae [Candidatus Altiarchaeota archaeon]